MTPQTHPTRSFVEVAPNSDFPIQNLPYGVFRPAESTPARIGVAIGEQVLDLSVLQDAGLLQGVHLGDARCLSDSNLNRFMAMGSEAWREARRKITRLLAHDEPRLRDDAGLRAKALLPVHQVDLLMPVQIGDYTDFYSSREHATNVGTILRGKENALNPNWLHLPVAYHGRASSIVVSGTDLTRPCGQTLAPGAEIPTFGPSRLVDFELEMGFFIGPGNTLGAPVSIDSAPQHIFGMVLVNDWSARDIQKWEYVPLGPFLAKNFGTSISPWVVTLDALEPFRVAAPVQQPTPLPYLQGEQRRAYDIQLEVALQTPSMDQPFPICRSNFRNLYWDMCQQLAHHTINGCNLRTGDLLASGTISGAEPGSFGSLLELTWRGSQPIQLPDGDERKFIQDGDRVTMSGWCQGDGYRVGFGQVTGTILPARSIGP